MNLSLRTASFLALSLGVAAGCGGATERTDESTEPGQSEDAGSNDPVSGDTNTEAEPSAQPTECVPNTCASLGVLCGEARDGCGGALSCGACSGQVQPGMPPLPNVPPGIQPPAAIPPATPMPVVPSMPAPSVTSAPVPLPEPTSEPLPEPVPMLGEAEDAGAPECVPLDCSAAGLDCGSMPDNGCGAPLECGECAAPTCEGGELQSVVMSTTTSRGMGFTGTDNDYGSLYDVPCETVADCEVSCAAMGGSDEMCAASLCLENGDGTKDCLPATVWRNVVGASQPGGDLAEAAVQSMVAQEYEDYLATEGFGFALPVDATVLGIQVEFSRASGSPGEVTDFAISLLSEGQRVGETRAKVEEAWGPTLEWASYGGETDLWGRAWTPSEINSAGFGAAISAQYLETAGNARAYVDDARITVYYGTSCD